MWRNHQKDPIIDEFLHSLCFWEKSTKHANLHSTGLWRISSSVPVWEQSRVEEEAMCQNSQWKEFKQVCTALPGRKIFCDSFICMYFRCCRLMYHLTDLWILFGHEKALVHMNSQLLWLHEQDLCKNKPDSSWHRWERKSWNPTPSWKNIRGRVHVLQEFSSWKATQVQV